LFGALNSVRAPGGKVETGFPPKRRDQQLERRAEKWKPVFRQNGATTNELDRLA
jgi:hypothetical protein